MTETNLTFALVKRFTSFFSKTDEQTDAWTTLSFKVQIWFLILLNKP